ncbi:MAG: hypothetical protein MUF49_24295 [Oculatellaceae cyanobacterium Prado106]|jgi:hypothetical protein|nr:hypothetical protein [Oculatellaceae cyanobacterium Prado106]
MSIQIGLYDFFAYTLPGAFLLLVLGYAGAMLRLFPLTWQTINTLSTPMIILGIALSYLLGVLLEPIAKRWYQIFQPKVRTRYIFEEFMRLHPDWKVKARPEDAGLLRAYIKQEKMEIALDIEKNGATAKMLRNFSFGLALLALILLIQSFIQGFQVLRLLLFLMAGGLSGLATLEATKYYRWFHFLTLETIAAFTLDPTDHVIHQAALPDSPFIPQPNPPTQP